MVEVAASGGHGAGRVGADAVPESDGHTEFARGKASHFGHVEQVALRVGEEPVEQGALLSGEVADGVGGDQGGSVNELTWGVGVPEQRLRGHDDADGDGERAWLRAAGAGAVPFRSAGGDWSRS